MTIKNFSQRSTTTLARQHTEQFPRYRITQRHAKRDASPCVRLVRAVSACSEQMSKGSHKHIRHISVSIPHTHMYTRTHKLRASESLALDCNPVCLLCNQMSHCHTRTLYHNMQICSGCDAHRDAHIGSHFAITIVVLLCVCVFVCYMLSCVL